MAWEADFNESDLSGGDFEPLDTGVYGLTVFDAEETVASTGSNMAKLTLKVQDGPYTGRNLWDNLVFTENSKWRIVQFLKAIRFDVPAGHVKFTKQDIVGKALRAQVAKVPDTYKDPDGSLRIFKNEIKQYLPSERVAEQAGVPKTKPKASKPEPAPEPAPAADDFTFDE